MCCINFGCLEAVTGHLSHCLWWFAVSIGAGELSSLLEELDELYGNGVSCLLEELDDLVG